AFTPNHNASAVFGVVNNSPAFEFRAQAARARSANRSSSRYRTGRGSSIRLLRRRRSIRRPLRQPGRKRHPALSEKLSDIFDRVVRSAGVQIAFYGLAHVMLLGEKIHFVATAGFRRQGFEQAGWNFAQKAGGQRRRRLGGAIPAA